MRTTQWICRQCAFTLGSFSAGRRRLLPPVQLLHRRFASSDAATTLPPALLQRARNIAAEHKDLQSVLSEDFDAKAAKRMGDLSNVANALAEWEAARSSLDELDSLISSPDKELQALARDELESTHTSLANLTTALSASLTPRDPYADLPCLLEIRPGPGGQEGRYFADALFKMYRAYCARVGIRTNIVKYETVDGAESQGGAGSETPLSEAVIEILDNGAYDRFRGEAGMHRVQRVPSTETKGRTHTSAVAVWVLPSFPESASEADADFNDPTSDFYIDPKEVKSEKMRAGGAGGQHVNKTESAIRLTHIPTGIAVSMQDSRSQHQNRDKAWQLLRSRVASQRREEREEQATTLRNSVLSKEKITRGDKIRTYNYQQDRCTDHRAGLDVHNLPDVLAGGEILQKVMDSTKEYLVARDIRALIAEEELKAEEEQAAANGKHAKK
ncbi:hypothetical protein BJ166DRAFT_536142 [Pestalotiopsis sp. NC0098]|nr:hypothetical protein BJ166DRAFT_536142 [Pestalotiopsis sp. NC0098]